MLHMKEVIARHAASTHTHTHTQIHIYTDFLLRVSVYASALGLQGFGMFLDPGPETHKDGPATGCEGGCGARVFLILPQTPGHGTTRRTHSLRRVIENVPIMLQSDGGNTCVLTSAIQFIHKHDNTADTQCLFPPRRCPNAGVNELVLNSFTSRQELHSEPWK